MDNANFELYSPRKGIRRPGAISSWDLMDRIPFMEAEMRDGTVGADKLAKLTPPRYMKTHIPYQIWQKQLEKHPDLKVIQVIRNPNDTLVSYLPPPAK